MLIELVMMVMVIVYIGVVALGHVLLIAAIYRCLREDYFGGRPKRIGVGHATLVDSAGQPQPAQ
ncbi:MAG TPA: hypothetical protein VKD43_18700 [Xanthobacteraceae bacterium]|nr:hypothetical protein [Xanthobacteraceae bacterium]